MDEIVIEFQDNLQSQYKLLPKMEDLINTHLSGKYMRALAFLLYKTSEVTRDPCSNPGQPPLLSECW